ncbi:MAG TPA: preprotein translocase subunit SecG [Gemmatimonadales bacterium]
MYTALLWILILDSLVLVAAVLLQAGQGGGLASLGGGSGTEMVMGGRQAVTFLHKVTWWGGGVFLGLSLVLALISSRNAAPRPVLEGTPAPAPVQQAPLPLETTPQPQSQTPAPPPNR